MPTLHDACLMPPIAPHLPRAPNARPMFPAHDNLPLALTTSHWQFARWSCKCYVSVVRMLRVGRATQSCLTHISFRQPQIRSLVNKIRCSVTILLPAFKRLSTAAKLKICKIPLDCRTRWSSTYQMLQLAIMYRLVLDKMTANRTLGLRTFELDDREWIVMVPAHGFPSW